MSVAFVFPGQGSQSLGMMQAYADMPMVRETFAQAAEILDQDLWALSRDGPAETLNLTIHTQPVMLTAGIAVFRAWRSLAGPMPAFMAGHSLGEYTALVAAGAISFADALPVVRLRAQLMQEACAEGEGAMAAILGLDDEAVRALCRESAQNEVLEAVNFNSPGQVVIAGHASAVDRGMELAKAKGAKRALKLPVSVPSHCRLMHPAAHRLAEALEGITIRTPEVPVLHNADVASHGDPVKIRELLARQLYSPVRWVETILAMADRGVASFAECGPGKVLAGLNKRIVSDAEAVALSDRAALEDFLGRIQG
jgi:[acyl-carrier-protein] S-malonyltransferase